jgi:hypothetical protein
VQREFVLSFSIGDENGSPLLERNIQKFTQTTDAGAVAQLMSDPAFQRSNLKHSVNGNLFCNLRLQAKVGERVRLYLISVGSSLNMHSITIRDNALITGSRLTQFSRSFAAAAYAGSVNVVDVVVERAGIFLVSLRRVWVLRWVGGWVLRWVIDAAGAQECLPSPCSLPHTFPAGTL